MGNVNVLKVYYAHSICLYGSENEARQLIRIMLKFKGAKIINPALHPNESMDYYLGLVENCNIVVFSNLLGKITSGVGKEVNHALQKGIEVYELNEEKFYPIKFPVKYISRQSTVDLYEQWWKRKELNI
jgi:hypothetical protein